MAKRGHSEEAILRVLRAVESGETVVAICRKQWISQQTFYLWTSRPFTCGRRSMPGWARANFVSSGSCARKTAS